MNRNNLIAALKLYSPLVGEAEFIQPFLRLLEHPRAYFRDHLPGHITGSAWIVDETKQSVLLTHHAKLNRWLQPGGHADGNENIIEVAMQEAEEETGIRCTLLNTGIFDIDIHTIPARKDFPAHLHYDIRFLFQANKNDTLVLTKESHDLAWIAWKDLAEKTDYNDSMMRMEGKVKKFKV